jgi:hypothetical protein
VLGAEEEEVKEVKERNSLPVEGPCSHLERAEALSWRPFFWQAVCYVEGLFPRGGGAGIARAASRSRASRGERQSN